MNILIFQEGGGALAELAALLKSTGGHDVWTTPDLPKALAAISENAPDIAIVRGPASAIAAVSAAQRAPDDSIYRSVIAYLEEDGTVARDTAYAHGADDVVVGNASLAELADHVRAAERVVLLERRLRGRVVELESALRRLSFRALARGREASADMKPPTSGGLDFLLTSTWTRLDAVLLKMCTEYVQLPFTQLAGAGPAETTWGGSHIALVDIEHELRLELSFRASDASARAIAVGFCGGDESMVDDDVVRDALLELANSAMGAVKGGLLGEEFRFSGAIPEPVDPKSPCVDLKGAEASRMLAFRSAGVVIHATVILRHQGKIKVVGGRLREGMVIAADVLNEGGLLLVRAGSRLTETTAEKLGRMFPKREFELAG